jgi:basic amino acid/polyamine antiporter, APA family
VVNLFAVLLCLLIAFVLNRGMKGAARFETYLVVLKVAIVLLVVVVGVFYIDAGNYEPVHPVRPDRRVHRRGDGVLRGLRLRRDVHRGRGVQGIAEAHAQGHHLLAAISMVLYVLACLVLTGMVDYTRIDSAAAFSAAFADVGLPFLGAIIAAGAILGILTVLFTFLMGASRVGYSMSRDGLLPAWLSKTDPKHHAPTRITWILGVASALIAGFLPIGEAAELTNIGILLAFVVVCVAVIVLRYRRPDLPRSFRCPGMPVVPAVGVVFSLWLISFLAWETWLRFAVWFMIGAVVYFGYGIRRSKLAGTGRRTDLLDQQ